MCYISTVLYNEPTTFFYVIFNNKTWAFLNVKIDLALCIMYYVCNYNRYVMLDHARIFISLSVTHREKENNKVRSHPNNSFMYS